LVRGESSPNQVAIEAVELSPVGDRPTQSCGQRALNELSLIDCAEDLIDNLGGDLAVDAEPVQLSLSTPSAMSLDLHGSPNNRRGGAPIIEGSLAPKPDEYLLDGRRVEPAPRQPVSELRTGQLAPAQRCQRVYIRVDWPHRMTRHYVRGSRFEASRFPFDSSDAQPPAGRQPRSWQAVDESNGPEPLDVAWGSLTLRQVQGHPERSRGVSEVDGSERSESKGRFQFPVSRFLSPESRIPNPES
jgi:hypothetical protein